MTAASTISLRFPTKALHAEIRRLAKQSNRSINQEIVTALQVWVEQARKGAEK